MRSDPVTANSTVLVECVAPQWGLPYPEATTQVFLEEYDHLHPDTLPPTPSPTTNDTVGESAFTGPPSVRRLHDAVVMRSSASVYNLFDFYAVFESISSFPNDLLGSGDGGSASGNQTVVVAGFGFLTDIGELYSMRFDPTIKEDAATGVGVFSANTTAPNHTVIAFTTPSWGLYFQSQLSTAFVVASHPELYPELALPNPAGYYTVGDQARGHGTGHPTFYWSRDWVSVLFTTLYGAKGGDLLGFSATGLSSNNTYSAYFAAGGTKGVRKKALFSASAYASSPSNLTLLTPPWCARRTPPPSFLDDGQERSGLGSPDW
jgi:hypothetical protein